MTEVSSERGVEIPNELLAWLFQKKLIPFLGAGCSVGAPSRIPSAGELARMLIAHGAGVDGQDLEDIAEEAWNRGGSAEFAQLLPIDEWRARPPNDVTRVIAELCREGLISQILTTNWDLLVEHALTEIGQPYAKIVDADSLSIEPVGTVTLIKLNGCIEHPKFIKATRSQIESTEWLDAWVDAVFDVLVRTNSVLFAGYSGASRAATTTIAGVVDVEERHAADFLVDRQTPKAIAESSASGAKFIEAIELVAPFTGEARDFFEALREAVYSLLLAEPATCARVMAEALLAPTALDGDALHGEIAGVVEAFKTADSPACQHWLAECFASFPDFEHTRPYLPLLPNATEVGKCLLLLAAALWAERLVISEFEFRLVGVVDGLPAEMPFQLVACHPHQRCDAVTRAAVVAFARKHPSRAAIGMAFGGIVPADPVTSSFSVTRGSQVGNAARGTGAAIGWIDGDALLAAFLRDADASEIQAKLQLQLDQAATRAVEAAA